MIAVFIDLKRAFETIDRGIMIEVLRSYGLGGNVLSWFESWLTGRIQRTTVNNATSGEYDIDIGLPQGTPLSCELFALYINLIVTVLKYCKIKLFADDILLWIVANRWNLIQKINELNYDLMQLNNFYEAMKLKLNLRKTTHMVISTVDITLPMCPNMNGVDIERVTEYKYLGVVIDSKLKFQANHQYLKKKMIKKISFLQRNKNNYDTSTKTTLFKSLISPHVDFYSTILLMATETQIHEIQVLQNRALRAILKLDNRSNVDEMLRALNLMDIKQRIAYNVILLIHKMKMRMLPDYLVLNLNFVSDVQPYNLRSNEKFRLPSYVAYVAQNSLFYKGVSMYNEMLDHINVTNDLNVFKKELTDYVKLKYSSH